MENSALTTALTSGLTTTAGMITDNVIAILPIILGVVGLVMASKFVIKFFKSLSKG